MELTRIPAIRGKSLCLKCRYKLNDDEFIKELSWYHNGHKIYKYIGQLEAGVPKEVFYPSRAVKVNVFDFHLLQTEPMETISISKHVFPSFLFTAANYFLLATKS